jgi:hypothetical protein
MARTTFSGPVVSQAGFISGADSVIPVSSATVTIDDTYNGETVLLARAAGVTATLPAATGTQAKYRFFVSTSVASNSNIIKVANSTDVMAGNAVISGGTANTFGTASTSDTITMNGSTTGGLIGSVVELVDIAAGVWAVSASLNGSGVAATPFSATV